MTAFKSLLETLNIEYRENENMAKHTSFKIGGNADIYVCPETREQIAAVISAAKKEDVPFYILGNGSNLLVSDKGIKGAVISTLKCNNIRVEDDTIYADAGASLTAVCVAARDAGLTGLEFAYGIPGSIGGALFMNAGAYDGEMSFVVSLAESITPSGDVIVRKTEELKLGYRESIYRENGEIITGVSLKLKKGEKEKISARMTELMTKRKTSQPLDFGSAGSTFKRPKGAFAAALIDECGLKGRRVGGAEVSTKHAGFVINNGNATANDVLSLIKVIQDEVYEKKNIMLETEVIFVGR